jgi:hypothetical protein
LSEAKHRKLFALATHNENEPNDRRFFSRDCGIRMTDHED